MPPASLISAQLILCEKVLVEKDNVHSVVRKVDLFYVSALPSGQDDQVLAKMSVLASARFQNMDNSEYNLSFGVLYPNGQRASLPSQTVKLKDLDLKFKDLPKGVDVTLELAVPVNQIGMHWMQFLVDDEEVARTWFWILSRDSERD